MGVTGTITQKNVTGTITQKSVTGTITESGYSVVGTTPIFVSAAVANATPTKVVLTYDQTLDTGSVPATTDFTVTDHTISGVAINGSTVELTLSTAVIYFDILYVTYTKGANPIQGDVGEIEADDLSSTLITNNVAVTGNEVGWWLASDLSTITKDGSNYVSAWNSKIGTNHLLQASGTNQPLWSADGILFDGVDNFLRAAPFTWNQPEFIIMVVKQVTWTSTDMFFNGENANGGDIIQYIASPGLRAYAGGAYIASVDNSNLALDTWGIIRVLFNGVSSKFQINETIAQTGNGGVQNMAGFILGAGANASLRWSNIKVQEIIGLNIAPSSDYETSLYNVVKRRAGL